MLVVLAVKMHLSVLLGVLCVHEVKLFNGVHWQGWLSFLKFAITVLFFFPIMSSQGYIFSLISGSWVRWLKLTKGIALQILGSFTALRNVQERGCQMSSLVSTWSLRQERKAAWFPWACCRLHCLHFCSHTAWKWESLANKTSPSFSVRGKAFQPGCWASLGSAADDAQMGDLTCECHCRPLLSAVSSRKRRENLVS